MENHQNPEPNLEKPNQQGWGTWEELLLACAVNRHGFKDWETIAMEVQSRTNRPHLLATPTLCEQKFHDLNRRFTDQCNNHLPPPQQNGDAVSDDSDHVPWLAELRKLRLDELRRDVQRSDVSIMSLQLQVKRLEEEKLNERDGNEEKKLDLPVPGEIKRSENDKTGGELEVTEPVNSEPETCRLDESTSDKLLPTTGDESDRENQSVNESNSTGSRIEAVKIGFMENMYSVPKYLAEARKGSRLGHDSLVDGMLKDGLWDVYKDVGMGVCAELCADNHSISREDQTTYARVTLKIS